MLAEVQLLDYTNSQLISIGTGRAKIQEGNFKLIHVIELDNHQNFIDRIRTILNEEITSEHSLYPYLNYELSQLQTLLDNIKTHKSKRSLDFIGSTWKWIAGNPDHEDFEVIKSKINNVLENNNKQVIINQLYNERINNITKMANMITNMIRKENKLSDQLALNIQYKLRLIKEEIINIKYAIHWAKAGIINSLILSNSEIKLAIKTIEKQNLPYSTPEEALDFANIKIISNKLCLLYIVYIPLTTLELYDEILLKPVKKNNRITEIEYKKIIKNQDKVYSIVNNCKTVNYLSICNRKSILDISNSSCLPNLLKSRPAKCHQTNNQHIATVDEISDGLILLNQFDGDITINNETQYLNGTYLVKFSNTTISIGNKLFIAREKSTVQVLPAILQPTPQENDYKEVLSLQMMKAIHINNTNNIELLKEEKFIEQISSYSIFSLIIIVLIVFIVIKGRQSKTLRIINTTTNVTSSDAKEQNPDKDMTETKEHTGKPESQNKVQFGELVNPVPLHSKRKFYETPFF